MLPAIVAGAVLAAAALFPRPSAHAEEIRVSGSDCTSEVRVIARDARFSDVLKQLAQVLDFRLSFESDSDPLINFDASMKPGDLLASLVPDANISATESSDPRCPRLKHILAVWVLARPQSNQPLASPVAQVLPIQETPEQARQAQEGLEMHMKAHGFVPAAHKDPVGKP